MRGRLSAVQAAWVVAGLAALLLPVFVSTPYDLGVAQQALIFVVLVQGFNFTVGITRRISLGHIGFWAIGAYTTALLTTKAGLPGLVAMAVGVVLSGLIAVVLAALTNRLQAHYLSLATLGFGSIVQIVATNWHGLTGGADGVTGIPPLFGLGITGPAQIYYTLLAVVALGAWFTHFYLSSKAGRDASAMRQSEIAAESLGIRSSRVKTQTLVISAVFGSVAGALYAHTYGYVSPDAFTFAAMLLVLAMLVVGGPGSVAGPIVGALLLTYLPEWMRISEQYWQILYGVMLFAIVLWAPKGVPWLLSSGLRAIMRRGRADRTPPPAGPAGESSSATAQQTGATR
ncbi:branched-chain amino acid ABC transporter permease [Streptomyces sp. NPDC004227]